MDTVNMEDQKFSLLKKDLLSIVCVDDEALILDMINYFIRDAFPDSEMRQARNGNEALTYCLAQPPDILVTNVNMPGMTGIELIKELRKARLEIPTLITSGDCTYERLEREGVLLGEKVRFIIKPFSGTQIIDEIKMLVTSGNGA
jgi:YesN/AraC family two-component response regulator